MTIRKSKRAAISEEDEVQESPIKLRRLSKKRCLSKFQKKDNDNSCSESSASDSENCETKSVAAQKKKKLMRLKECKLKLQEKKGRNNNKKQLLSQLIDSESEGEDPIKEGEDKEQENEQTGEEKIKEILKETKSLFRMSSTDVELVGRESQKAVIERFVCDYPLKQLGHSLFISGCPGTGKTAFVAHIMASQLMNDVDKCIKGVRIVAVNCMAAGKNPKMIYPKIYSALTDGAQVSLKDSVEMVEQNLSAKKSPFTLFFLDEIDQLAVAGDEQNVLYRIFEWPHIKKFKCALIGVANSMDMVEKILPRLKSKNCAPQLLSFPTYTAANIKQIIKARLDQLQSYFPAGVKPHTLLMQEAAIDLCSKKVAAYGDFRKALDVCRHAFEELEKEAHSRNQKENDHVGDMPKVTVKHVIKVLDAAFGSGNPSIKKIMNLTAHSKMILAVLSLIEREKANQTASCVVDSSVYQTFDIYSNAHRMISDLPEISKSEYHDVLISLESVGLINIRPVSGSASSTPSSKVTFGTPKLKLSAAKRRYNQQATTPKSSFRTSFGKSSPASAPAKMSYANPSNMIMLMASEEEVIAGIKSIPYLAELFESGLPKESFTPRYFGDLNNFC